MAGEAFGAKVTGLPDLRAALLAVPGKLRKRVLRNALAAGAREVRNVARQAAPKLAAPVRNKSGAVIRKPGTVADALAVRTSKQAGRAGDVGVFVNVRPAKGARFKTVTTRGVLGAKVRKRVQVKASQRGAASPNDPFYWRFLEFGTRKMAARPFLQRAATALDRAREVFTQRIQAALDRINARAEP